MQILVVEDDFISRRLLCRYLEPLGTCDVAINGREAMEAIHEALHEKTPYDLVCLDIMMPLMDGHETLVSIRALEAEHDMPVGNGARIIMTTSVEDSTSIRRAFSDSADGYVVKPVVKQKLYETLADLGLEVGVAG